MGKNTVDERGRVTIPKYIREDFHLKPGEEVEIREEDDKIIIKPKKPKIKKIKSGKKWDESTFLDAGEATFGSE